MSASVKLTEIRQNDSHTLFNWINDRNLVIFNSVYRPVHYKNHDEWVEKIVKNKDISIFAIRLAESDELIGTCQLHSIEPVSQTAELQIRIGNTDHQSKGFGTAAVNLLVDYGFKSLNLRKIYLYVFEDNTRALKTYLRCGFQQEGLFKNHVYVEGAYKNLVFMSKFKD